MDFNNTTGRELRESIAEDARKIHEIMCIAAIIIFPVFAFFDVYTIPNEVYWELTTWRLTITVLIALGLFIQKRYRIHDRYLSYFAFLSISWFCAYACVMGGKEYMYQHNIAYCTVFLAASLFILWHWSHSLWVVLSSIAAYVFFVLRSPDLSLTEVLLSGGSVLLSLMALHPVIVAFRYNAYKREFYLKQKIELSNELLREENKANEQRNKELMMAREQAQNANQELLYVNQSLEQLVKKRTVGLEEANEKMRAAMAELDLFLYSSYHDLKSPIARMRGLLELQKREGHTENSEEYYVRMLDTLSDMESLIEKLNLINTFANYQLQTEVVSLRQMISDVLFLNSNLNPEANVLLNVEGDEKIHTDRILIFYILKCVIENALMYSKDQGKHEVKILVEISNGIQIRVRDNGIGISPDVLPNIFDMYFRGNEKSKGHGLGLFITKKAVEKLNGQISIHSEPGHYTEFVLKL